jgi:outer membrane protein OmpA-like peptidoglycan-associated protein
LSVASVCGQPQASSGVTAYATSSRELKAVNYRQDGSSQIGFKGTPLAASARGEAKVDVRRGAVQVDAKLERLAEPSSYGREFLTYVLWAVTPEGRARNLGELVYRNGKAELKTTVPLQEFGLFVTAEPYFSVTVPSYAVVAENAIVAGTQGKISGLDVKVELFERGQYAGVEAGPASAKLPESLRQARLAVQVAKAAEADRYAAESFAKAEASLRQAESYQSRKGNNVKPVTMVAREAVQNAEDARVIAVRRQTEEAAEAERQASAKREADARAAAQQESERAARAAREREQAEAARATADQQRQIAVAESRAATAERETALIAKREAENERRLALAASEQAEKQRQSATAAMLAATAEKEAALKAQREADTQRVLAMKASEEAEQRSKTALADMEAAKIAAAASKEAAEQARKMKEEAERERALMAEERNRAIADKQALRARLLEQFQKVLDTRDTERGLVLNMGDVLFDTGKYALRPVARERLARLSGILSAYPGLNLEIEGHTDSTGSDALNQKLSEQRASEVGTYLVEQQTPRDKIQTRGFGKMHPVATNDTTDGRQANRRVEIIVSGEVIGTELTDVLKK